MNKQQLQELKEYLEEMQFKAIQSGKSETSGLVSEVIRNIGPEIEKTVNGKIKRLDEKLTEYIGRDEKWKEEHRKTDKEWKDLLTKAVLSNTEYRLKTTGGLTLLQFLVGFIGFGTIVSLIKLFT